MNVLRLNRPVIASSHFFGFTFDAAIFTFKCLIKSLANLSDDLLSRTLRIFESNKQINVLNTQLIVGYRFTENKVPKDLGTVIFNLNCGKLCVSFSNCVDGISLMCTNASDINSLVTPIKSRCSILNIIIPFCSARCSGVSEL